MGPKEGRRGGRAPAARLLAERFRPELLAHKLDGIEVVAEPRALLGQPAARGAGCSRRVRRRELGGICIKHTNILPLDQLESDLKADALQRGAGRKHRISFGIVPGQGFVFI